MKRKMIAAGLVFGITLLASCESKKSDDKPNPSNGVVREDAGQFKEVATLAIGGGKEGAAEISAYDSQTKQLFVVNNAAESAIEVVNLSKVDAPAVVKSLPLADGAANSVATHKGMFAVALENSNKQANGLVQVYEAKTYKKLASVSVGALPDMIAFSPDGKYIVCANEGEPNDSYTNDPVGSISVISVADNYSVKTAEFTSLEGQKETLAKGGFRIFGLNASFAQDIEPEYVTISPDSKTAWVSLQENNGIAKVDLASAQVTAIFPLPFKDYGLAKNAIDVSDKDGKIQFRPQKNVYGMPQPDAIDYFEIGGKGYIISANEGDARDYEGFSEEVRVEDIKLDESAFPNAKELMDKKNLGRLKITNTLGDANQDGYFDKLYSYGARSFSIWDAQTGKLVYDSNNKLETDLHSNSDLYPDKRSDDKGVEPEGVDVGKVGDQTIAFIGLERADAVLTYDISNPKNPVFLQVLKTGKGPEGVLFISAEKSPNQRSLLVVSAEIDGNVKIFQAGKK